MKFEDLLKWDRFGLKHAEAWAGMSKDPSTQVGAYIADVLNRPVSAGYNGFPRGVLDTHDRLNDRSAKYPRTVHAELNAILNAPVGIPGGSTLYIHGMSPCASCAGPIIQVGIMRVICRAKNQRVAYDSTYGVMRSMFAEANVELIIVADL